MLTKEKLAELNPGLPPSGSVLPCRTLEEIEYTQSSQLERYKKYLLERAQNFALYHDAKMTEKWIITDNKIQLDCQFVKKEQDNV